MAELLVNANSLRLPLADESIDMCVTSPPYYGLRDYGTDAQLGLEESPEQYIENMVAVFREVKRVMKAHGTLWLNIGDSYAGSGRGPTNGINKHGAVGGTHKSFRRDQAPVPRQRGYERLKPKDLIGIPWMLAFALRADGWYLRSDIIWCLSGGTYLYARTQKGDMPIMVRDLARLDPKTVQLWNGKKWTRVLGWSRSARKGDELELVLRKSFASSNPRLVLVLPEPDKTKDSEHIDLDAAWFAGLYLAEGSMCGDVIQIAGHSKEEERWVRVKQVAQKYGGSATRTIDGNSMSIRVYGKLLVALIDLLVSGKTAKKKCLSTTCWRYSNKFLRSLLDGYLSGDGHWDKDNNRWRLGFTRNYNLERDLRTLAARLGFNLTLNLSNAKNQDGRFPSFRGELKFEATFDGHWNQKNKAEIIKIRKARCREVYDIGVEDEPHLFALASGILTHNSKPNPMPESVTDRPTKAHEYLFLLSKQPKYYYDADAVRENPEIVGVRKGTSKPLGGVVGEGRNDRETFMEDKIWSGRNRRSVWSIATTPYPGAHFATFPPALVEPCIKAGTSEKGVCPQCGTPWERIVERTRKKRNEFPKDDPRYRPNTYNGAYEKINGKGDAGYTEHITTGWQPTCTHDVNPVSSIVFDPFVGSGTTVATARRLGRKGIGLDVSFSYLSEQARARVEQSPHF